MAQLQRQGFKFHCKGVNLGAVDTELALGEFPFMVNVRALQQGGVTTSPSQGGFMTVSGSATKIRTLNNLTTQTNFIGTTFGELFSNESLIYDRFSSNPLSMVRFRPDQSPESWMYIADQNAMLKVNAENKIKNWGMAPPTQPPSAEISTSDYQIISEFSATTGWTSGASLVGRVPGGTTIAAILYDSQLATPTGYCCVVPSSSSNEWAQPGARITLNSQLVTVEDVLNPITATTVTGQAFDTGTSGLCCITLGAVAFGLERNSVVHLDDGSGNTEYTRVLSSSVGPDGLYSFRCSTVNAYPVGSAVVGKVSLRLFDPAHAAAGQAIAGETIQFAFAAPATGGTVATTLLSKTVALDLSQISGRAVQPDDKIHISIKLDHPENLLYGNLLLDVDASTNDFTENFYQQQFRPSDYQQGVTGTIGTLSATQTAIQNAQIEASLLAPLLTADPYTSPPYGPLSNQADGTSPSSLQLSTGASQWSEMVFPVSDLQRVGTDTTRALQNVAAIGISLTVIGAITGQFSAWYVSGTYGPDVPVGTPTGIRYRFRYRDKSTGAKSIPGPATRYDLFPVRQQISVTCPISPDPSCDIIDIERLDPNLQGGTDVQWHYTGSVANTELSPGAGAVYLDNNTPEFITTTPSFDLTAIQPFPILLPPILLSGEVIGTTVQTGGLPMNLLIDTEVRINGVVYLTYNTRQSGADQFEITASAGRLSGAIIEIDSPVVYGQPLPYVFGPLDGPTAGFVFGLGDSNNPGYLYWTNGNDPDSCDTKNFLEVTPTSEPLISGVVWNSYVFVASKDRVFRITPTFDQANLFTATQIPATTGVQGRWLMAAGIDGIYYAGIDGIYKIDIYAGASLVSQELWPLFQHDGKAGVATNGYPAISYSPNDQLCAAEGDIYLCLASTAPYTWRYSRITADKDFTPTKDRGWFPDQFGLLPFTVYYQETNVALGASVLCGVVNAVMTLAGGGGQSTITMPPFFPSDDKRANHLYVDLITDMLGTATMTLTANLGTIGFNPITLTTPGRNLVITNLVDIDANSTLPSPALQIYRDLSATYVFGPGTIIYEFQPQFYPQPLTRQHFITQFTDHGIPGWKVVRFSRLGVISPLGAVLTIKTTEGQEFNLNIPASLTLQQDFENTDYLIKFRMASYRITPLGELDKVYFIMFPEDCYLRMKKFGSSGPFEEVQIFGANS